RGPHRRPVRRERLLLVVEFQQCGRQPDLLFSLHRPRCHLVSLRKVDRDSPIPSRPRYFSNRCNVYVTFRTFAFVNGEPDAIYYVKSTNCGATFSRPVPLTTFVRWDAQDRTDPQTAPATSSLFPEDVGGESIAPSKEARARDCGD